MTLTVATNTPLGGSVTGGGGYTFNAVAPVTIAASNGWYVSEVTVTPPGTRAQYFQQRMTIVIAYAGMGAPDFTTITDDAEWVTMNTNITVAVTFNQISPTFSAEPANQTVLVSNSATFSAGITGRFPLWYQWQKNGTNIVGATNTTITLTNLQFADAGQYSIVSSNAFGVSNSIPATLVVSDFIISTNGAPVNATTIAVVDSTAVTLQSRFTGGQIFYTLDGSTPDFTSTPYTGPIYVSTTCALRAIAYSADLAHYVTAGPLSITVIPTYSFSGSTSGGGTITLDPPGGLYPSNTTISVVAIPLPGWTFMGWSGDMAGCALTNSVTMTKSGYATAMFGTTVATTIVGGGTVTASPSFPLYPYGFSVQLMAEPNPGQYFAFWGNAGSGTTNPLTLTVSSSLPTVSALFASLPSTNVALTVLADNGGAVIINPPGNRFPTGSNVVVTAIPSDSYGNQFVGWSGDASGTINPLTVSMNTSKVITAHFSSPISLWLWPDNANMQMDIYCPHGRYSVETSTNLVDWTPLCMMTNYDWSLFFTEPITSNIPTRMYRVVGY